MIKINIYLTRIAIRIKVYLIGICQHRLTRKRSKKKKSLPRVAMKKKQKSYSMMHHRSKITSIILSHYLIFLGPLTKLI